MTRQLFKPMVFWPTPVLVVQHPDAAELNKRLAEIVLQKEREILTHEQPTAGATGEHDLTAYRFKYNVLNWDYPECRTLREMVLVGVREFVRLNGDPADPGYQIAGISCWANVLRHGESIEVHHHDPGYLSAHYTVQSGHGAAHVPSAQPHSAASALESGNTVYYRPGFFERSQGERTFGSLWDLDWRISTKPQEGNLTFFPSYVRHEVRSQLEPGERISIAMDIYIKKQQLPFYFAPPRWYVPAMETIQALSR